MSIEVMRQARNALVWNLNTDLDNIPACDQWAKMLRKNIDALDKAIADAELKWVGLTEDELYEIYDKSDDGTSPCGVCGACAKCKIEVAIARATQAKLKKKNT